VIGACAACAMRSATAAGSGGSVKAASQHRSNSGKRRADRKAKSEREGGSGCKRKWGDGVLVKGTARDGAGNNFHMWNVNTESFCRLDSILWHSAMLLWLPCRHPTRVLLRKACLEERSWVRVI
jgi:hypothetical protein